MNPKDYKTWTTFAEHPIFSERRDNPSEWSSEPQLYDDFRCDAFDPEWYVHQDPKLPTDVQTAIAQRDIRNLASVCSALADRFANVECELFILDDLTVFVRVKSDEITLDLYPHDYGDGDEIMTVHIDMPIETEFTIDSVSDAVPRVEALIKRS